MPCAVVESFYSIGSVFGRVAGRCLLCLQWHMIRRSPPCGVSPIFRFFFFFWDGTSERKTLRLVTNFLEDSFKYRTVEVQEQTVRIFATR